jgi:biopolymer transport protein ExbB/TolQ
MESIMDDAINTTENLNSTLQPEVSDNFLSSVLAFFQEGGLGMYFILFVLCLGLALVVERYLRYKLYDINAKSFMNTIQNLVMSSSIREAIQHCSGSKALLSIVIKNGLKRSNQGTEQIQNAIDASTLEIIPKVEKRLSYLNLLANISTLLGLLGTIFGLIQAFAAVSAADPSQKAQILSMGISKAMNTTAFGLISAIFIMVCHSLLTAKSEKIINDIDQYSVKLLDMLGTIKIVEK